MSPKVVRVGVPNPTPFEAAATLPFSCGQALEPSPAGLILLEHRRAWLCDKRCLTVPRPFAGVKRPRDPRDDPLELRQGKSQRALWRLLGAMPHWWEHATLSLVSDSDDLGSTGGSTGAHSCLMHLVVSVHASSGAKTDVAAQKWLSHEALPALTWLACGKKEDREEGPLQRALGVWLKAVHSQQGACIALVPPLVFAAALVACRPLPWLSVAIATFSGVDTRSWVAQGAVAESATAAVSAVPTACRVAHDVWCMHWLWRLLRHMKEWPSSKCQQRGALVSALLEHGARLAGHARPEHRVDASCALRALVQCARSGLDASVAM